MKTKLIIFVSIALFCLLAITGYQHRKIKAITIEKERLENNQTAHYSEAKRYRTKDSLSVISVERLQFTKKELEKHKKELTEIVKGLNIKVKRLQSASETSTNTDYDVITPIKDSIKITITDTVKLKCINYETIWVTFNGCFDSVQFNGKIATRDTIIQVVHRVPKQWWFIKYGTKGIKQEVLSKNPHTTIIYNEYIELTK